MTEENENLKQNNSDLIDEFLVKKKEVQDLEEDNEKKKLKSSSNSLEELQEIEMYKCEPCSLSFINPTKLREHMKTLHLEKLNRRLIAMTNLNKLEIQCDNFFVQAEK